MVSDQAMIGNSDRQAEQVPAAASQCNKVQVIDVDDAVRVSCAMVVMGRAKFGSFKTTLQLYVVVMRVPGTQ